MLNLINIGFEHSVMASIDGHRMIVVANNGGFVIPEETDASLTSLVQNEIMFLTLSRSCTFPARAVSPF